MNTRLGPADPAIPPETAEIDDGGVRARYDTIKANASGEEVADRLRADGGSAVAVEADLADPATVPMLFDTPERHAGTVGLLVNNADHCLSDTFVPQDASTGLSAGGDVKRPFSPEAFHARQR